MAEGPTFALFVSAVAGSLVRLYGTTTDIGARRSSEEEIAGGAHPIVWDEASVTPISEADYAQYRKEYDRLIRAGALKQRTADDYQGWLDLQAKRSADEEAARLKAIDDARAAADAAADEAALQERLSGGAPPPGDEPAGETTQTEGTEES